MSTRLHVVVVMSTLAAGIVAGRDQMSLAEISTSAGGAEMSPAEIPTSAGRTEMSLAEISTSLVNKPVELFSVCVGSTWILTGCPVSPESSGSEDT